MAAITTTGYAYTATSDTTIGATSSDGRGGNGTIYNSVDYNWVPSEIRDEVELIMGKPGGAKFIISYAYKKAKDPVVFIHSKKAMLEELRKILKDEKIDKRTILISEIKKQFKPKKLFLHLGLKEIK